MDKSSSARMFLFRVGYMLVGFGAMVSGLGPGPVYLLSRPTSQLCAVASLCGGENDTYGKL